MTEDEKIYLYWERIAIMTENGVSQERAEEVAKIEVYEEEGKAHDQP